MVGGGRKECEHLAALSQGFLPGTASIRHSSAAPPSKCVALGKKKGIGLAMNGNHKHGNTETELLSGSCKQVLVFVIATGQLSSLTLKDRDGAMTVFFFIQHDLP